jgi:uncharacterized membrane protein
MSSGGDTSPSSRIPVRTNCVSRGTENILIIYFFQWQFVVTSNLSNILSMKLEVRIEECEDDVNEIVIFSPLLLTGDYQRGKQVCLLSVC